MRRSAARVIFAALLPAGLVLSACSTGPDSGPPHSETQPPHTELPQPAPPTQPPPGSVTEAALPHASDLGQDWVAGATGTGGGTKQLSVCQQTRWESTGASSIVNRSYTRGGDEAAAVVFSFDSVDLATQAYRTTQGWFADCQQALSQRGGEVQQSVRARPVQVDNGKAEVSEWTWGAAGGQQVEAQGLVQVGNRIEVIALRGPEAARNVEQLLPTAGRTLSS